MTPRPTKPHIIAIIGPTGSGKTQLSLLLAKKYNGIIISADSRQLYKGMNVGTAKVTHTEQRGIKHYMLDIIKPSQRYSAYKYQQEVYKIVRQNPDRPIFLVGGTYFYVDAVLKGWDFSNTGASSKRSILNKKSLTQLQNMLRKKDPITYRSIDKDNKLRLVRALEVVSETGRSFYGNRSNNPPKWHVLKIGIKVPRSKLDLQNRKRIDRMFRAGWVAEVKKLGKKYRRSAPGFLAHGYREVFDYVSGRKSLEDTKECIYINTRHFVKRQMAWYKNDKSIKWLSPKDINKAGRLVKLFLSKQLNK